MPAVCSVFLGGCTAIEVLAPPVDNLYVSEARLSTKDAAYLGQGRNIYLNSCSSCHSLHQVDEITPEYWRKYMPEMYRKAKLYDREIAPLEAYLKSAAKINQTLIVRRELEAKK